MKQKSKKELVEIIQDTRGEVLSNCELVNEALFDLLQEIDDMGFLTCELTEKILSAKRFNEFNKQDVLNMKIYEGD